MGYKTDLPVLLPLGGSRTPEPFMGLKPWHVLPLTLLCIFGPSLVFAAGDQTQRSPLAVLADWAPLLLQGFVFNLVISVSAMALGTAVGALLGIGQISPNRIARGGSWFVTQFFRNAPWLVLLFFAMFLLPFEISIFGLNIPLPDWLKAILGLSLPVPACPCLSWPMYRKSSAAP